MSRTREPYVGSGIDGALRSAQIDESEADTLDPSDPRRPEVLESARRWREQADALAHNASNDSNDSNATSNRSATDGIAQAAELYDLDETFRQQVDGQ